MNTKIAIALVAVSCGSETAAVDDLADSLDISRCQIEAAFDVAPATTEPDVPSTDLVPLGDYTFADAITSFQSLIDLSPSVAAQSGASAASTYWIRAAR